MIGCFGMAKLLLALWMAEPVQAAPSVIEKKTVFLTVDSALLFAVDAKAFGVGLEDEPVPTLNYDRLPPRKRLRKLVSQMMDELGPYYTRRAYRMKGDSFWKLHRMIKPNMKGGKATKSSESTKKNGAPNGIIPSILRLSAAIRYFAGGDPLDIQLSHGMSHTEVFNSVWYAMDTINLCPDLKLEYPSDPVEQRNIAKGYEKRSRPHFKICGGALDGCLVWMMMPTLEQCELAQCDRKKFLCGWKKRFGVNLQGVCETESRFLDTAIGHPASTSDYLAFVTGELYMRLEEGLLADGLCLFGDNAYVDTPFLETPFKAVKSGTKDDYNFYHFQLCIKIECAFGILVKRWGILWSPLSSQIALKKVGALVMCLCRPHSFCINERLAGLDTARDEDGMGGVPLVTARDSFSIAANGGIPLEPSHRDPGLDPKSPEQLLHAGEHFDDPPRTVHRRMEIDNQGETLPREILHDIVAKKLLQQSLPNKWKGPC